MTSKQTLLLKIVCTSPRGWAGVEDIAREMQTNNEAVGRMIYSLSTKGFVSRRRVDASWEIWATEEGRAAYVAGTMAEN
jgi:predicted transcriptional regulator